MYQANENRYDEMVYNRCGKSGLKLPAISLGLYYNFGGEAATPIQRDILCRAFDLGITHFDLANNYGPPYGAAEKNFGELFKADFRPYRDELIISTKAGFDMWPGPYGNFGSKKYLMASLDQSLKRVGLDYVDIFYHHRPDPDTPLEETMETLALMVRQGKALYVGISNYKADEALRAIHMLKELRVPYVLNQVNYSMLDRWIEKGLTDVCTESDTGIIAFMPLQQGLLTGKYIDGIPDDSRIAVFGDYLKSDDVTSELCAKLKRLNVIAQNRGQTLAQLALAWVLRQPHVASALIGASRPEQIEENVHTVRNLAFTADELNEIENCLT